MSDYEIIRPRRQSWPARLGEMVRSITLGPWNPRDPTIARYFGSGSSSAGVSVSEESSMSYAAVWNAVGLISGDIAKVPLQLYRRLGDGGKEPFREHPLYELLHDEPNPEMSSFQFRRVLQGHVLVWGNGYAEIERDAAGRPVALWPLMPYSVQPYREGGALRYRVFQPSGNDITFDRRDVLHLSGMGQNGIDGYPVIRKAMESIGLGIATQRFAAKFYEQGATMGTVVTYPTGVGGNPQTRKENREALEKRHEGVNNAHRMLVLYEGGEVKELGIPPDKAQFLETRRFNIEEVARWFNIPVHKLKELARSTNNNIEHQGIEYATDTLQPWFRMWEGELRLKLIPRLERKIQFFEHVTEALTRGDSAAQGTLIGQQFVVGSTTPNEIRAKFNMNPRPDGNDIYVPSNTMPADLARKYWEASIEALKAKPTTTTGGGNVPGSGDETKALQDAVTLARKLAQAAEDARDRALENARRADEARELVEAARAVTIEQCEERLADAAAAVARADATIAALTTERDGLLTERDSLRVAGDATAAQLGAVVTERDALAASLAEATAQRDAAIGDFNAARVALVQAEADRDAALALGAQAEQDRDSARLQAAAFRQTAEAAEESAREAHAKAVPIIADLTAQIVALGADMQAEQTKLLQADAARAALQASLEAAQTEAASARNAELVAQSAAESDRASLRDAVADLNALAIEAETLRTDTARARADLATELDKQRTQKAVLLAAMRSLFVDACERLLYRESERARKNQATPDKLRNWLGGFYAMHAAYVRDTFRPLVGPWTAVTGGAPNVLLDRLVADHLEQSEMALRRVADTEDADELAANLERTLNRWERERAESMADALVREGIGEHG